MITYKNYLNLNRHNVTNINNIIIVDGGNRLNPSLCDFYASIIFHRIQNNNNYRCPDDELRMTIKKPARTIVRSFCYRFS